MFKCIYCDTDVASPSHYKAHLATSKHKRNYILSTNVINTQQDDSNMTNKLKHIIELNNTTQLPKKTFICKCCNKSLASKFSLDRHYRVCQSAQTLIKTNTIDIIDNLLDNKIDKSLLDGKQPINIVINNITNNNNTNNTNNNTNNVNVLQIQSPDDEYYQFWKERNINPVGFENLDMLTKTDIADRIHGSGLNAFMELIKVIYSDSQNHNVALYNKREKLVKYLNSNGEIEITTMQKMLDLLVQNNIDVLDKFLDDKDITIRKTYKSVIDKLKFIHEQDGDNPYFPKYVEALRLILLNISKSALEKIADFEQAITKDLNEIEKIKNLTVPRTDLRLKPS